MKSNDIYKKKLSLKMSASAFNYWVNDRYNNILVINNNQS